MKTSIISRAIPAFAAVILVSSAAAYAAPMGGFGPGVADGRATPVHMRGHGGPGGAAMFDRTDHIEGRIAFLKAELKITDAQNAQWEAVAKALRDQSAAMTKLREDFRAARGAARKEAAGRKEKDQALTAPEVLARREQMRELHAKAIAVRAEGQKQFAAAFTTLYDSMSAEQKKIADSLFARGGHARFAHRHHR